VHELDSTSLRTPPRTPFLAAFESTYLPGSGVDVADTSDHSRRWRLDLDAVGESGVVRVRYPLLWHRIESEPGRYDWSTADATLEHLRDRNVEPIVDLVHHTSYPEWLSDGFRDRRFGPAYLAFAEAVARRYPWLTAYTLFNEPFATLFLAGHEALWPPYDRGIAGFARLLNNVLPAVSAASQIWSELLPDAQHVWVDTCEQHAGSAGSPADYASLANDRRHVALDLAIGHDIRDGRPFLDTLLAAGGDRLVDLPPVRVDVLGLDYYCHSEWWYDDRGSRAPSPHPLGFAAVAAQYADRYDLPLMLSETNIRGLASDKVSWLRYTLEQYELAVSRGIPLQGYCWFPFVDSCDWDSLLARPAGRADPVGVLSLGEASERRSTSFTSAWEAAASGAPAATLPAYRFQSPCDEQLQGFLPQMAHWPWQNPPLGDVTPPVAVIDDRNEIPVPLASDVPARRDLVVLSHLRWIWVWQRPQHLVSRFATARAADGARTWFVEEPVSGDVECPELRTEEHDGITRVWLVVPKAPGRPEYLGFDDEAAEPYGTMLRQLFATEGRQESPDVLLYTPMALDVAEDLAPSALYYDVMDDLASFLDAPQGLVLRQRRALTEADVVFAGGRSLHRSVAQHRNGNVHLFPSGVETAHYAASRELRGIERTRKVAGYVGVIDERVDLDLIRGLAEALPDWTIRVVGPVTKIDPGSLPNAANIEYPGLVPYPELPSVMAGFDVALMPFALNEATRAISPTKTLEYLAAGLPVVSTRVPDVVSDFDDVVHLADDAAGFADACRHVVEHSREERDRRLQPIARRHEWDVIAASMIALMAVEDVPLSVSGAMA
jgi:beta-glucosidase/6-phospho-beta-glucosidase/beta-galactosidase/glycosyltransferase involved in cell wall biosynthesis